MYTCCFLERNAQFFNFIYFPNSKMWVFSTNDPYVAIVSYFDDFYHCWGYIIWARIIHYYNWKLLSRFLIFLFGENSFVKIKSHELIGNFISYLDLWIFWIHPNFQRTFLFFIVESALGTEYSSRTSIFRTVQEINYLLVYFITGTILWVWEI